MRVLIFIFFAINASSMLTWAQGGPPMVTDDPGTPGDKHWEINIAALYAGSSAQSVLQSPYFDINYGWGERTQLKLETGFVTSWSGAYSGGLGTDGGAGASLIGVKYRFLDEDTAGFAVSTYPQVQFRHFFSSSDPELAPPGNQYFLPVEFSKTLGSWALNPDVGFQSGTGISNQIFYGLVIVYENAKPWELLSEVHVNTNFDGTGTLTLVNFGFRRALAERYTLLGALGYTLTTPSDTLAEIIGYFGLQIEI